MGFRLPTDSPRLIVAEAGSPLRLLAVRLAFVLALIAIVMVTFWLDRDNLYDSSDGSISFLDVVYFTMVTITTVGYGDIVPVGDRARLLDALVVTPIRLLLWLVFLGTTYQLVLQRVVETWRIHRLSSRMKAHIVVIGFGYEGRMATRESIERGYAPADIVVIDEKEERLLHAAQLGCVGVRGDATKEDTQRLAKVESADAILVCLPRDDTTALCVLTARNLGSAARIIASAREEENIQLLRQAGADEVIAPAKLGGYLMADAVSTVHGLRFVSDLLTARGRLRMVEREVARSEVGMRMCDLPGHLVVALERENRIIGFWSGGDETIRPGDRLFAIHGTAENPPTGIADVAGKRAGGSSNH